MKILHTILFFLIALTVTAQPFDAANIVVVRVGNGLAPLTNASTETFLDEIDPFTGNIIQSIPLYSPGSKHTLSGDDKTQGGLNLSADGKYLFLGGFYSIPGVANVINTNGAFVNRLASRIDYNSTVLNSVLTFEYHFGVMRSATSDDGSRVWVSGPGANDAGIRYATVPYNGSTTQLSATASNRSIGIYNSQLYVTSVTPGNVGINTVGTGLPTSGTPAITLLPGLTSGVELKSRFQFVFFDINQSTPGPDLLYVADDDPLEGGLKKFYFDGSQWHQIGFLKGRINGLAGRISCSNQVFLYTVFDTPDDGNAIYRVLDATPYNAPFFLNGNDITVHSGGVPLITAGANQAFRGIALTPANGYTVTNAVNIPGGSYNVITVKNGGIATLTGNIYIADKVIVESGGILLTNGFTIYNSGNTAGTFDLRAGGKIGISSPLGITTTAAAGNIQTCRRYFSKSAKYLYKASVSQFTGDALPDSVLEIEVDNSGLTLSQHLTTTGSLKLTKGVIASNASSVFTIDNSCIVTSPVNIYGHTDEGYRQDNVVKSYIKGPVRININSTVNRAVPLGGDSLFAPIRIQKLTPGAVTYTAEYFPVAYSDVDTDTLPLDHVSNLEHWMISSNVTGISDDAKVTLSWSPYSTVGNGVSANNANALDDLVVAHYINDGAGYKWKVDGADMSVMSKSAGSDVLYGQVTTNFYTATFSPFTLGTKSALNLLPVRIITFSGVSLDQGNRLIWEVEDESSMKEYIVERSADATNFSTVTEITSLKTIFGWKYFAIDRSPFAGDIYYRLKMINIKGEISYSHIIRLKAGAYKNMFVWPNPAKNEIRIQLPPGIQTGIVEILNVSGSRIKSMKVESDFMIIPVTDLVSGIYIIRFSQNGRSFTQKLIKE